MYGEGEGKGTGGEGREEWAGKRDAANGHGEGGGEGDARYDLSEKAPRAWVFVAKCQACPRCVLMCCSCVAHVLLMCC